MHRKLAAIVAADVVGYSRLFSNDEETLLRSLEQLRTNYIVPKASAYSGRVFRFLGDGTLVEFDSVLHAVEFAIDVQKTLAERYQANPQNFPIRLRIGINLGDVVFEQADMHGDGVNIAVRLEALAEPGGICLSDSVYAQIKHKISDNFSFIGPQSLKNIVDPVHVWRWQPNSDTKIAIPSGDLNYGSTDVGGRRILDPKIVDLLLRLHARSALLAISDALDAMIDEMEDRVRTEQLYHHITQQLYFARSMLNGVYVERADKIQDDSVNELSEQTLGEFVASMLNDKDIGYVFKVIPELHKIFAGDQSLMIGRKRFLNLVRQFHNEDYIIQCRNRIKYAAID